jgi:hypothetical protein
MNMLPISRSLARQRRSTLVSASCPTGLNLQRGQRLPRVQRQTLTSVVPIAPRSYHQGGKILMSRGAGTAWVNGTQNLENK